MKRSSFGIRAGILAGLLLLGECGRSKPGRVLVVGLDGMGPQTVDLLMSEGTVAALQKGLRLEPDNALFSENLQKLQHAPNR
jgi:hypothetical protein